MVAECTQHFLLLTMSRRRPYVAVVAAVSVLLHSGIQPVQANNATSTDDFFSDPAGRLLVAAIGVFLLAVAVVILYVSSCTSTTKTRQHTRTLLQFVLTPTPTLPRSITGTATALRKSIRRYK